MALTPFVVDGKSVQIDSDPQMPLLYALRDDLKLNNHTAKASADRCQFGRTWRNAALAPCIWRGKRCALASCLCRL